MPDIIQLLPDAVANQIAAGEVVQRPASAVKELLENAVDSGASEIQLIVKDAGKTLIRVIDNGCGMSDTDARLSFERHATSKIRNAEELWHIRTKGFRGEALASVAAIAHVELKTRLHGNEVGTKIRIAGSKVENQEPCATPRGTAVSVMNLFYNTPARRNFLKSDQVEMRHITEEFERVALAHPDTAFRFEHNGAELFNLAQAPLRLRIVNVFGPKYNERLVPVKEETAIVALHGFICKPEYAKKTRGEQYFFVNDRFIKNAYLHHAVNAAFEDLIPRDSHPSYFLYISVDPSSIDVNIHPTKTEIKFAEERSIYAIIRSAVKNSLGKYNISPSLDFEQEDVFNVAPMPKNAEIGQPQTKDFRFNPFETSSPVPAKAGTGRGGDSGAFAGNWEALYEIARREEPRQTSFPEGNEDAYSTTESGSRDSRRPVFQLHGKYILTQIKSGVIIIDRRRAHERILYEEALSRMENRKVQSQQLLFPETVHLSSADRVLLEDLSEELADLGFTVDCFGGDDVVVNGVPPEAEGMEVREILESLLEQYKNSADDKGSETRERLARSMAAGLSAKEQKAMQPEEMLDLIDRLFACKQPQHTPSGNPVLVTLSIDELDKKFKHA